MRETLGVLSLFTPAESAWTRAAMMAWRLLRIITWLHHLRCSLGRVVKVTLHGLSGNAEHLSGNGNGNGNKEGETHDGPHVFGRRTLSATWLPERHDPGRTVMKDDLGIPTRDFAMDASQDFPVMVLFKEQMLRRTSIPFIFLGGRGEMIH